MPNRREFLLGVAASGIVPGHQTLSFAGTRPGEERAVTGIRLCWCPPGRFVMGSPSGETGRRSDEAQVDVTLTRGFWMAKFEIAQEWCRDWYHARLPGGVHPDLSNARGMPNRDDTYSRVRRGGAWIEDGWACRSAVRLRYEPDRVSDHIGLRVALSET
jgi:formylglycine-generating enzyme required for sulfatase activity